LARFPEAHLALLELIIDPVGHTKVCTPAEVNPNNFEVVVPNNIFLL